MGALGRAPPEERLACFVGSFGSGETLDLVHLSCLARLRSRLRSPLARSASDAETRRRIFEGIERHRSRDGGYADRPDAERGTAYAAFLAVAALEDLEAPLENRDGIARSLLAVRTSDGGFGNLPGARAGSTTATAAATTVLRHLDRALDAAAGTWLLAQCGPTGGFKAVASAPVPDLLSTATALHALRGMGVPIDGIREACLDFVESLWTPEGGFHGVWGDDTPDCEYTYYGLLALGNLV
jgi:prenyltransferase beta subunit